MKRWVIYSIITFRWLSFSCDAQTLHIQNNEVQSFYGDSSQTVSEVFANPRMIEESPRKVNSLWILDLNTNQLTKIKNNEITHELPISVSKINNTIQVKILDGWDNGLLIETTDHESVTWYWFNDDLVEYQKWIDFDIIKTY
ncbi:MAG: hypothetical protein FJZ80_08445 [Bacteroidetes bacterium]|nr:hypothetical protein [Bacteroidota bacterium]MBM3424088.1 hypothetical protein [Bacteroidota bacterium]